MIKDKEFHNDVDMSIKSIEYRQHDKRDHCIDLPESPQAALRASWGT